MTDSPPLEQQPRVAFEKLLQAVAFGNTEPDVLSSLAGRLARLEHSSARRRRRPVSPRPAGGLTLKDLAARHSCNALDAATQTADRRQRAAAQSRRQARSPTRSCAS